MTIRTVLSAVVPAVLVSACTSFSHTNIQQADGNSEKSRATFAITADRPGSDPDTLMILALSGGGSRAAYLSASVMLRLEEVYAQDGINLLHEVDAISSVSGGSLPAAYYVISADDGPGAYGRVWDRDTVRELMRKDYIRRWFGNWFWPTNIGKFWFTAYDRSDIMAQTFADNLFDNLNSLPPGRDLKIGQLLESRPYLVLNSTNGTATPVPEQTGNPEPGAPARKFGARFTFTDQDFDTISSDINDYSLARAVMATATFPAVFNYMTLQDYRHSGTPACDNRDCFVHVFDGGNADNLGLKSVSGMLDELPCQAGNYDRLVVILVDAYTNNSGIDGAKADPRAGLDFFVDTNFLDATDSLLSANRDEKIEHFREDFSERCSDPSKAVFYHIQFADIREEPLNHRLNRIKTDFRISNEDAAYIDEAVEKLLTPQNTCLAEIRDLLVSGQHQGEQLCVYTVPD